MPAKQKQSASFVSIIFAKLLPLPFPPSGCLNCLESLRSAEWALLSNMARVEKKVKGFASHNHSRPIQQQQIIKLLQKIRVVRFVLLFYLNNKTCIVKPSYAARDLFNSFLNNSSLTSSVIGQQQTFRPFFDTRFTSGLLDFRRKSDPFSNMSNDGSLGGSGYDW